MFFLTYQSAFFVSEFLVHFVKPLSFEDMLKASCTISLSVNWQR